MLHCTCWPLGVLFGPRRGRPGGF